MLCFDFGFPFPLIVFLEARETLAFGMESRLPLLVGFLRAVSVQLLKLLLQGRNIGRYGAHRGRGSRGGREEELIGRQRSRT